MLNRLLKRPNDVVPSYTKKRYFGTEEKAFYGRLRRALPKCYIFPDVQLSAMMVPTSTDARQKRGHLDQLKGRQVDFAIFDARLNLLFVIELTGGPDERAEDTPSNAALLASAGIRRFCWDADSLPSTDQTLRAFADFVMEPVVQQGHTQLAIEQQIDDAENAAVEVVPGLRDIITPRAKSLTVAAIEALTPDRALKSSYPHVYQRICLFCAEPDHLQRYLASLSIQDRSAKRAGFGAQALAEIARVQNSNAGFIRAVPVKASWNDAFADR